MMKRSPRQAVEDILVTIDEIRVILGKKDPTVAMTSIATRRAIERCLQIICEAVKFIPPTSRKLHPNIPWDDIYATGNILRHEYINVSGPILLNVVREHLKPLKAACEAIRRAVS